MRFLILSHHLPPAYNAGAELYALRQSLWLQSQGHTVQLAAVEDIEAATPALEVRSENYLGMPVHRLYFNRLNYDNPFEVSHDNPEIAAWLAGFLDTYSPDIILVNACYLLGVGVLRAARRAGVPVVVYLHDFWFLCQRITLMRPDGSLCNGKVSAEDCASCLSQEKRGYLWADKVSGGRFSQAVKVGHEAGFEPFTRLLGGRQKIDTLRLRRERLMRALEEADQLVAPSRFLKQVFEANGLSRDKIMVFRIGEDAARLEMLAEIARARPSVMTSELRVGFLGQTKPHKGVHLLIKAFRRINPGRPSLSIHGAFDPAEKYHRHLKKLAGDDRRINFAGPYRRDDLPAVLAKLDVVVVPSVWLENSPLVIMEAQAAGLPVVATDLGGMAEMVLNEQNGLLFARNDVACLAHQLNRLVEEDGLLTRLAAGIRPPRSTEQEFAELMPVFIELVAKNNHLNLSEK